MSYCVNVGLTTEISYSSTTVIALGDDTTALLQERKNLVSSVS